MQLGKNRLQNLLRFALFGLASLGLLACERTAVFQPKRPDTAHFQVFHLGTYSSKIDEDKEIEGTIFQTTLSYSLEKQGSGWLMNRKLDTLVARGYHKFSMPHELEKKMDLKFWMDSSFVPTRIEGYDSLKSILSRIEQKEEYRKQLLLSSDTAVYRAQYRDWWRAANFLPYGQKLEAKQTLPVEALNSQLETYKVDSARFDGPRPRMKKSCLDYTLYYHRTDSLPLLVEQFYFSALPNRKFRQYTHTVAAVFGILQYSVDRKTGLPCFQSKSERGDMTMTLAAEKIEVPIHLFRYEEDLYD